MARVSPPDAIESLKMRAASARAEAGASLAGRRRGRVDASTERSLLGPEAPELVVDNTPPRVPRRRMVAERPRREG